MALPEAATKLRMVLDYLPCEACLAHPVEEQDLLCTICARLDRQVAVRVGTRTTVLLERPSPPEAPVVIPPAVEVPQPAPAPPIAVPAREVLVRMADEPATARTNVVEVVLEPIAPPPAPVVAPLPEPAPQPEAEPEPEFDISDIVDFVPAREEFFDYRPGRATPPPLPPRAPEPVVAPARVVEPAPRDDYVFRPPPQEEPVREPEREAIVEEIFPAEEVPVESAPEERQWAPPPEEAPVELAPVEEEEVLEMEVVEEDEVVEMELVEEEEPAAAPAGSGELYRLRGFDAGAEAALARKGITEIAHLSGHDAGELAQQTGVPLARMQPWVQVADLVHEVGVPVDAAVALVAAGVAGPRGLRDADAEELADRVSAFGGAQLRAADIRRWKRRA